MTSQRKNILVGLTVLGAFVVMGWMIIQFGGRIGTLALGTGYEVRVVTPRVDGLSEGGQVRYLGYGVGRVQQIRLNDEQTGFEVDLRIDAARDLPGNVVATIRAINMISGAAVVDLEPIDPVPQGSLREVAEQQPIEGRFAGSGLVPDEFSGLASEIRLAVQELRASGLIDNINRQVEQIGELARSLNEVVGDEEMRGDLRQSAASIRQAAASAERISSEMVDFTSRLRAIQEDAAVVVSDARQISGQLRQTTQRVDQAVASTADQVEAMGMDVERATSHLVLNLERMGRVLADLERITATINEGRGTAGKLINDDRLYEALVINVQLLEQTVRTSNRLLAQWEQEGVRLRFFR